MPEHVETAGGRLQRGRLDTQPLAGKIEQAGERLACFLAVGFDIAGLDQRGDDSPALFGEIGRALHDALAQPFAFVTAKQALELQTESPGDIRHGRAELGGPLLPLEGQLRIELAEMLGDEIPEPAERRAERVEVEQFEQQVAVISPAPPLEFRPVGSFGRHPLAEPLHGRIADDAALVERRTEHEPVQTAAPAQRDIDLPVRKRRGGIDHGPVESKTLTFVDRNRPGRPQRILHEPSFDPFGNLFRVGVDHVFRIRPLGRFDGDRDALAPGKHLDPIFVQSRDRADPPVVIALLGRRIVLDEHDLSPFLQHEGRMRRIKIFGKGPFDFGLERVRRSVELGKPPLVDRVGRMVVRRERDVALVVPGTEAGDIAAVQLVEHVAVDPAVAHAVQQLDEAAVALAVDALQLDTDVIGLLQRLRVEEKRRIVESPQ